MKYAIIYLALISFAALILTAYDKKAAQKSKRRIPEATLMTIGVLGGALVMYIVMEIIRHKTRHAKFMIGLPIIILLQIGGLLALHLWVF